MLFVIANLGMNVLYYNRALPNEYLGRLSVSGKTLHSLQHIASAGMLPAQLTFGYGSMHVSRTPASRFTPASSPLELCIPAQHR